MWLLWSYTFIDLIKKDEIHLLDRVSFTPDTKITKKEASNHQFD